MLTLSLLAATEAPPASSDIARSAKESLMPQLARRCDKHMEVKQAKPNFDFIPLSSFSSATCMCHKPRSVTIKVISYHGIREMKYSL